MGQSPRWGIGASLPYGKLVKPPDTRTGPMKWSYVRKATGQAIRRSEAGGRADASTGPMTRSNVRKATGQAIKRSEACGRAGASRGPMKWSDVRKATGQAIRLSEVGGWSGPRAGSLKWSDMRKATGQAIRQCEACGWAGSKIRCVGSALSPNGLAFEEEGMLSMALLHDVLWVDPARKQVRGCAPCSKENVVVKHHGKLFLE
jgi:hypothetical protein